MKKRKLGGSGLEVPILCFGGNVFDWTVDEQTSFKLLDKCLDTGLNFIDTADLYSVWVPGHIGGESETIIGRWLKRKGTRGKMIIATKVGMEIGPDKKGLSKKYILQAAEDSLKRLQTDYIDLYQSHTDDPNTPMNETLEAYATLIKQGKVRTIGASNYSAERLAESLEISKHYNYPRYESLQPQYNLCEREDYETKLESLCRKENIGVISYYSLASGFLSGKYKTKSDLSQSIRGSRVEHYLNAQGLRILNAVESVAKEYNSTPAAISLAWLIARPGITAPIASATSIKQLEELIAATQLELDHSAIELLNNASAYPVKVT